MVSVLDSGASGLGSTPGRGYCVVFVGETLYSHSASLHPHVKIGTGELLGITLQIAGSDLRWTSNPSRGSRNTPDGFMLQKLG